LIPDALQKVPLQKRLCEMGLTGVVPREQAGYKRYGYGKPTARHPLLMLDRGNLHLDRRSSTVHQGSYLHVDFHGKLEASGMIDGDTIVPR
jgi:hypothetical protein